MKMLGILAISIILLSCSSVTSKRVGIDNAQKGFIYYMPKKDIVVTVTVPKDYKNPTITIGTTDAYPDLDNPYLLNLSKSPFSKNEIDVTVNVNGLLSKADFTLTSKVEETLKSIASSSAALGISSSAKPAADNCIPGTYSKIIDVSTSKVVDVPNAAGSISTVCGINFSIKSKFCSQGTEGCKAPASEEFDTGKSKSGIYYKRNIAYLVEVTVKYAPPDEPAKGNNKAVIRPVVYKEKSGLAFSPSQSHTHLMPIGETFFANNTVKMQLTDGILTKYNPSSGSEFAAFFGLPATIIAEYSKALLAGLKRDQDEAQAEQGLVDALLAIEKTKFENQQCRISLASGEAEEITKACK